MPNSGQLHWDQRDGRVAAVAAAVVYSLWALEVLLPGGGDVQGALADPGTAFGAFLDSAHRTAAVLVVIAAGIGLALGARVTGVWLALSWWAMAVFGASSLLASVFPGPCLVSTDVACAAESLAEGIPGATAAQAVLAVVAVLAALVGVGSLAVDRFRAGDRAWAAVAVLAVLQAAVAAAVLVVAARVSGAGDGSPGVALGLLERGHLAAVALWLLAAGVLPGPWKRSRAARTAGLSR